MNTIQQAIHTTSLHSYAGHLFALQSAAVAPTQAAWKVQATAHGLVLNINAEATLDAAELARLVKEVHDSRQAGFGIAIACDQGPARLALETVHIHRFVEVFNTAQAATRWLSLGDSSNNQSLAA